MKYPDKPEKLAVDFCISTLADPITGIAQILRSGVCRNSDYALQKVSALEVLHPFRADPKTQQINNGMVVPK